MPFQFDESSVAVYTGLHDGIPPANLPVETSVFFLGINLRTARAAGLEIPNDILQQADFIVRE
jgi:hypothetical protein